MTIKGGGERTVQLDVQILGREFKIGCKEHERAELKEAVAFLDARMREIRDGGKIAGVERIAVMAALNIANDLLRERKAPTAVVTAEPIVDDGAARRRIQSMHAAIEQMLATQDNLL